MKGFSKLGDDVHAVGTYATTCALAAVTVVLKDLKNAN
jgi:hypothetical protein